MGEVLDSNAFDSGNGAVTHAVPGLPQEVTVRHTCDHLHRFKELVTKSEEWKGSLRQACVNVRHPPSKASVDVQPWTRWS